MSIIKQITRYVQGELSEQQALRLWEKLWKNPEDLKLLEMYLMLDNYYGQSSNDLAD